MNTKTFLRWTHRVATPGGGFWCYSTSLAQALKIAGGDASRIEEIAPSAQPAVTGKAPIVRLVEAIEMEPVDVWAAGRAAAPIVPTFPLLAEA